MAKTHDKMSGGRMRAGKTAFAATETVRARQANSGRFVEIAANPIAPDIKPGSMVEVVSKKPGGRYVIRQVDMGSDKASIVQKTKRFLAIRAALSSPNRKILDKDLRQQESEEIITRVVEWAGGEAAAQKWFRSFPIPAFGGRTAESLVDTGHAKDVREYLDSVALGAYS